MPRYKPPLKNIDLVELEKLCAICCTQQEIAAWFNLSGPTIQRRHADSKTLYDYSGEKLTFRQIMDRGYAKGRISLRRKQMQMAENGNATMLVWLGKMILGQRETVETQVTGPSGGAFKIEIVGIDPPIARKDVSAIETVQYLPEVGSPVSH